MQSVYGRADSKCLSTFECMLLTGFTNDGWIAIVCGPKGDLTTGEYNAIII